MFKPLPEMYLDAGLLCSEEISTTPPGKLVLRDSKPIFIREVENTVRIKKKIVFSDNFLYILAAGFYNNEYLNRQADGLLHKDILSKLKLLVSMTGDEPRTYNYNIDEEDRVMLLYYSYKLQQIISDLLEQNFEVYFHIDSTLVEYRSSYQPSQLAVFLFATQYGADFDIHALFAANDIPPNQVYILNLSKITKLIGDYKGPCLTDSMAIVLNIFSNNTYQYDYINDHNITTQRVRDLESAQVFQASFQTINPLKLEPTCLTIDVQNQTSFEDLFVPSNNLKVLNLINSANIDFELPTYSVAENITIILKAFPNLEIIVDRDKIYLAKNINQEAGAVNKVVITPQNIIRDNLLALLNQELKARLFCAKNISAISLLSLVSKLSYCFKASIKCLDVSQGISFKGKQLEMLVKYFPNLRNLRINANSVPQNICDNTQLVAVFNQRHINLLLSNSSQQVGPVLNPIGGETGHFKFHVDDSRALVFDNKIFYSKLRENDVATIVYRNQVNKPQINKNAILNPDDLTLKLLPITLDIQEWPLPPPCLRTLSMNFRETLGNDEFFVTKNIDVINQWTKLPSLYPNEVIKCISILDYQNVPRDFRLGYCANSNFYYIRLTATALLSVTVNMVIDAPSLSNFYTTQPCLLSIIQGMQNFELDNFKLLDKSKLLGQTLADYLVSIIKAKTGTCLERCIAFANLAVAKKLLSIKDVRLVTNDAYAFCEIRENNRWLRLDFGGLAADIVTYDAEESLILDPAGLDVPNAQLPKATLMQVLTPETDNYALGLLQFYTNSKQLACYIHDVHDIVHNNFEFKHFLQKSTDSHSDTFLIINLKNFNDDDLLKIDSILDQNPRVAGLLMPSCVRIIALYGGNRDISGHAAVFCARFDQVVLQDRNIQPFVLPLPSSDCGELPKLSPDLKHVEIINCHASVLWRDMIFGDWDVVDNKFNFKEGSLLERLMDQTETGTVKRKKRAKVNIILNKPPLTNDFKVFWSKAYITKSMFINGKQYSGFDKIFFTNINNLSLSESIIEWDLKPITADHTYLILNDTTFEEFLRTNIFEPNRLSSFAGHIGVAPRSTLWVHLTHNISEQKWSKLLYECQKAEVRLKIVPPQNLILPEGFKACATIPPQVAETPHKYCIIAPEYPVDFRTFAFNVAGADLDALVASVNCRQIDDAVSFEFIISDVVKMLLQGRTVVLYGNLNQRFAEKFASMLNGAQPHLLINGRAQFFAGKLYCMPLADSIKNFNFAPKIKASECDFITAQQGSVLLVPRQDESIADNQFLARVHNFMHVADVSPVVYITGKTGIGKSRFVCEQLKEHVSCKIFHASEDIFAWAECNTSDKYKFLFYDDANMSDLDFNVFDSMFFSNRHILYKGRILPLSKTHIVVLASSLCKHPYTHKLLTFVQQHPQIKVDFAPLNKESINCELAAGLLAFKLNPESDTIKTFCAAFIKIYLFVAELDPEHVYITAQEIRLALYLLGVKYFPHFVCEMIFINSVPAKYQEAVRTRLKLKSESVVRAVNGVICSKKLALSNAEYVLTDSRKFALSAMHSVLTLRNVVLHRRYPTPMSGLVLDGAPESGKFAFVNLCLRNFGFSEIDMPESVLVSKESVSNYLAHLPVTNKHYLVCNHGIHPEVLKQILIQAYIYGLIVVVNKFNSYLKSLEPLLPALLNGKFHQATVRIPGFLLIALQDATSLQAQTEMQHRFLRHMIYVKLPDYSKSEILEIMRHKFVQAPEQLIETSVDNFVRKPIFYLYSGVQMQRTLLELTNKISAEHTAQESNYLEVLHYDFSLPPIC